MDTIADVNPGTDSTLALLLEAQSRGWRLLYGEIQDIWLRDGEAFGRLTRLRVADDPSSWFTFGDASVVPLGDVDAILMRKDPPFDAQYVLATYVLERAEDAGALVVNRPQGLRDVNEKAFVAWFPDCAPPTIIGRALHEMNAFVEQHGRVVVKPLDLMAGRSVFVTDRDDGNRNVILDAVTDGGTRFAEVQKYVPDIREHGDKRIFLIDGVPITLALARIPPAGDHRGNLSTGARGEVRPLTARDEFICARVGPVLRERGLLLAGIDVIGDFLTEINVTSPTGVRELERDGGVAIATSLLSVIEGRLG
jgi:glutathione synthase